MKKFDTPVAWDAPEPVKVGGQVDRTKWLCPAGHWITLLKRTDKLVMPCFECSRVSKGAAGRLLSKRDSKTGHRRRL